MKLLLLDPDMWNGRLARLLDRLIIVLMIAILLTLSLPIAQALWHPGESHLAQTPRPLSTYPVTADTQTGDVVTMRPDRTNDGYGAFH